MQYFVSIYRLFVKKRKPKVDEFDEQFIFILILGFVTERDYLETKQFYFYLKDLKDK
jgi:hypothetical protein